MLIPISEITVSTGRREALTKDVQALADSISAVGLINPITVDCKNNLIAGFHRLEAAKLLDWTEIECTVCDLEGLQLELAEIDEDFIRKDLSDGEFRELLLRRKEVYENLHPETKNGGDRKSEKIRCPKWIPSSINSIKKLHGTKTPSARLFFPTYRRCSLIILKCVSVRSQTQYMIY